MAYFYKVTFRHKGETGEWFQIESSSREAFRVMNHLIETCKMKRVKVADTYASLAPGTIKLEKLKSFYFGA
ncbi:hypothetical protein LCGC14_2950000 [marine sediment metagenome]|uniref:Uncharacterized protein n=1 Tax=marine sediment metagenome TaxID=412755 RepID=A0A0F9A6P9_9ZZZZ